MVNSKTTSGYPDRKYIYDVFQLFNDPPEGTRKFFDYVVDDDVHWQVTGQHRFSGTWTNKKDYYDATWANINLLLADRGYKMEIPGGEEGVIVGQDGWSAIELKTVGTSTKSGVPYQQHYSWHCRWSKEGKIVEVKAFLDADHLEKCGLDETVPQFPGIHRYQKGVLVTSSATSPISLLQLHWCLQSEALGIGHQPNASSTSNIRDSNLIIDTHHITVQLGGYEMLRSKAEVHLGDDDATVKHNEATHATLERQGPDSDHPSLGRVWVIPDVMAIKAAQSARNCADSWAYAAHTSSARPLTLKRTLSTSRSSSNYRSCIGMQDMGFEISVGPNRIDRSEV
nr:hypothetical protein CFP56_09643 [Quercus suber]